MVRAVKDELDTDLLISYWYGRAKIALTCLRTSRNDDIASEERGLSSNEGGGISDSPSAVWTG